MANNSSNISIIFVTIKKKKEQTNQNQNKKNPPKIQQTCDGYIEHVII